MAPDSSEAIFAEKVFKVTKEEKSLAFDEEPEYSEDTEESAKAKEVERLKPRKYDIRFRNVLTFGYVHVAGIYGLFLAFTSAHPLSLLLNLVVLVLGLLGLTVGAHRLWSHRAYKAKLPLRILLMTMHSMAFQNTVITWARDHRMHHKYSDTDADPHNAGRGFFYSHVGWLLVRRHPELIRKGPNLDFSDLYNDPVLQFQKKFAIPWIAFWCFGLPTIIPMWAWGETFNTAWHVTLMRYMMNLNFTFLVNSLSHSLGFGYRPYDRNIRANQHWLVSFLVQGEGFHNFHHTFPWDYRTSEYGNKRLNLSTIFIDAFKKLGWAYDLRTVNEDLVRKRMMRSGDGTDLWGYGDKDMSKDLKETIKAVSAKST